MYGVLGQACLCDHAPLQRSMPVCSPSACQRLPSVCACRQASAPFRLVRSRILDQDRATGQPIRAETHGSYVASLLACSSPTELAPTDGQALVEPGVGVGGRRGCCSTVQPRRTPGSRRRARSVLIRTESSSSAPPRRRRCTVLAGYFAASGERDIVSTPQAYHYIQRDVLYVVVHLRLDGSAPAAAGSRITRHD